MQTVACQTDTKELVELRVLQESLSAVRDQLTTVSAELGHTERRLRSEVREEYDERMRTFERRTKEKVKYMKQKQEQSVTTMRKALNAQLGIVKLQQEAELRQEADRHAEQVAAEAVSLRAQLEKQELRIAAHVRENAELREQMELQQRRIVPYSLALMTVRKPRLRSSRRSSRHEMRPSRRSESSCPS